MSYIDFRRPGNRRILFRALLFAAALLLFTWNFLSNETPITKGNHSSSVVMNRPSNIAKISQTCLSSYDSNRLQKSSFNNLTVNFNTPVIENWVKNKTGFEIGGPSIQTWGSLGLYDLAAKIDGINFASDTLWEKGLKDGSPYMWNNRSIGVQYIRDAVDLKGIPDDHYDIVLSSHVLEHIANPFKALLEWIRILRSGGWLMTIVPWKERTFDHKRKVDRMEHLINDYLNHTTEADLSHLEEIISLHDFARDPPAMHGEFLRERSQKNLENRGLHHHVYDEELLYYIYVCLNLNVTAQYTWGNSHLIVGQKN